jgi:hypothetical protein
MARKKDALEEEIVAAGLLFLILDRLVLVDPRPEVGGVSTESDVECGQEAVHAGQESLGSRNERERSIFFRKEMDRSQGNSRSCTGVLGGFTLKDDYAVGKVRAHEEIVPEEKCNLGSQQRFQEEREGEQE